MPEVIVQDLGLIDYKEGWDYQDRLFTQIIEQKIANRKLSKADLQYTLNYFLLCEHPHVITLGKSGDPRHLLLNEEMMKRKNISYYQINRGGDITYHGPGQIVGYPILDLDHFFTDIHKYLRLLEEMIILTLKDYGIEGGRIKGATGVWLDPENPVKARKICAMGIRCSRWVTMHGFAFNVNNDIAYFDYIIPCGISDKQVTSLSKELGKPLIMEDVKSKLMQHFSTLFHAEMVVPC